MFIRRSRAPLIALASFGFAAGGLKSEPVISAGSHRGPVPTNFQREKGSGSRREREESVRLLARERGVSSGATWRTVGIRHMARNFIRPAAPRRGFITRGPGTVAKLSLPTPIFCSSNNRQRFLLSSSSSFFSLPCLFLSRSCRNERFLRSKPDRFCSCRLPLLVRSILPFAISRLASIELAFYSPSSPEFSRTRQVYR